MSFLRHEEIFPNDPDATPVDYARAHRPDESPVGYSLAGCSPALPASASPTSSQCALNSSYRSTDFHRTANCVLSVCLTPGGRPSPLLHPFLVKVVRFSSVYGLRAFDPAVFPGPFLVVAPLPGDDRPRGVESARQKLEATANARGVRRDRMQSRYREILARWTRQLRPR
jgi:hypothetical protein